MRKTWTWLRWFLVVVPIGLTALITAPIIYPIAELLKSLKRFNPFWMWLDDTAYNKDGSFAEDYYLWLLNNGGLKETFIQRYKWCAFRNTMWNLKDAIKPKEGKEIIYDMKINSLIYKGEPLLVTNESKYPYMAALKFIDKDGNSGWQVNQGEFISFNHTIHGTSYFYYTVNNTLYFRYSQVKVVRYFLLWKRYRTLKLGTNNVRYVLTLKYTKLKPWVIG